MAASPVAAVDHDREPSVRLQDLAQRAEPDFGRRQVVKHAAGDDVVERPQAEARQILDAGLDELDIREPPHLRPFPRYRQRRPGEVERDHPRAALAQLFGDADRGVAGAAAGVEDAEPGVDRPPPGPEQVVDGRNLAEQVVQQPPVLVLRIAGRVRIFDVLVADRFEQGHGCLPRQRTGRGLRGKCRARRRTAASGDHRAGPAVAGGGRGEAPAVRRGPLTRPCEPERRYWSSASTDCEEVFA